MKKARCLVEKAAQLIQSGEVGEGLAAMLEAIQCYEEDRNCATASYELAIIFLGGINGASKDLEKGNEYMSIAASMGLADANMELCHSTYLYRKNDQQPPWSKAGRIMMPHNPPKAILHLGAAASWCTCRTSGNCVMETTSAATGEQDTYLIPICKPA